MIEDILIHYGMPRRSGRYPWGSGENPYQNNQNFLAYVADLRKKGMSDSDIARGLDMNTTQFRQAISTVRNEQRQADISTAMRLKEKGMSNVAIGQRMGINESSVRSLLAPAAKDRANILTTTSNMLRDEIASKKYLDVGRGTENHLGISRERLNTAIAKLQEEGYTVHYLKVRQLGTGNETSVKVLAPPDTKFSEVYKNRADIRTVSNYSEDGGRTFLGLETPKSVAADRVTVRYGEDGGKDMDGVIELRRGVEDISLGTAKYAQVRISVNDTHYLKGMAIYADDLPDGVDLRFNTPKSDTGNKLDAMKSLSDDPDNPFGSIVRQRHYVDSDGKKQLSAINIVGTESRANEEGAWGKWSKTISSQILSKQTPTLAKRQLDMTLKSAQDEYDEIVSLTNPSVKKKLLNAFADNVDSSSVHLKAAHLPRQSSHVLLPVVDMPENEVYAPNYRDGERLVLIRHPHGGTFEIPELTVNNRNPSAKRIMGNAKDAVGINPRVAERLSGADFDGDAVVVIPNNNRSIKTSAPLKALKNFDPQTAYPGYEGMVPLSPGGKQQEMGYVSNLITDMTIKGATPNEIARAVKHSMVVIDAEKHKLNHKQSYIDNGIAQLKTKYQGSPSGGASTLISRASSEVRVDDRRNARVSEGGPIDKETGQKRYVPTGETYTDRQGRVVKRQIKSTRMAETPDARTLMGDQPTPIEEIYASHANGLKALANTARKSAMETKATAYSPSANKTYKSEVDSLNSKLNVALKNAPLERQALLLANNVVALKKKDNPHLEAKDIKKIEAQALAEARLRTGARKQEIEITPKEWEAIQAGAVSPTRLNNILDNASLDTVKELATPRTTTTMTPARLARARSMMAAGYTQAEIADQLGISTTTLNRALEGE